MAPSELSMNLWLVVDRDRWGYSQNIVRAETADEALRLVLKNEEGRVPRYNENLVEVVLLPAEGEPAIVWCYDHSPDTPGERD